MKAVEDKLREDITQSVTKNNQRFTQNKEALPSQMKSDLNRAEYIFEVKAGDENQLSFDRKKAIEHNIELLYDYCQSLNDNQKELMDTALRVIHQGVFGNVMDTVIGEKHDDFYILANDKGEKKTKYHFEIENDRLVVRCSNIESNGEMLTRIRKKDDTMDNFFTLANRENSRSIHADIVFKKNRGQIEVSVESASYKINAVTGNKLS